MQIVVATPTMHRQVSAGYSGTVAAIGMVAKRLNIEWRLEQVDTSFIVDARNALTRSFLAQKAATHMLMIDSDSEVPPAAVERLLRSGFEFAALPFPTRRIDLSAFYSVATLGMPLASALAASLEWCIKPVEPVVPVDGWIRAERTGFGCVLLARRVIEAMGDDGWFNPLVENGTQLSEDMSFCVRAKPHAELMILADQVVWHNGTFSYGARLIDDPRLFLAPATQGLERRVSN